FSAYAAKASRLYIDKKLSAKGIRRGYEFYRDLIFEILDLNLFEEIEQLKVDLSGDERYAPLFLYARHREVIRYSRNSHDDLQAALALNVDPVVSLRIKREMLSFLVYSILPLCDADWERHGDFIRACYEEFPDDDMVNYCLGQYLCLIEEDNALGMLNFNKVVEVNPRLLNVYYARSRAAFVLGLYSQAVEDMQVYISNVTHHAPAYNIMGGAYIGLKDYAQACGCYIRSIGLSGVNEVSAIRQRNLTYAIYNAYINCSADESSYYKDVSIKQVIDLFATLNKKNLYAEYQTGAEAFYYAARSCYEISLYERGVEYCDCALDLYKMGKIELPGDIIELKACFFFAQGKYQELIDFCLGHVTYCDRAYYLMGTAYVELKDYYQACNCYISSIELMGVNEVPAVQQHLLVYTLFQAYINCPAEESAYYSDVFIKQVIELFATLNKKPLYADCQIGADAFYFAARSCYEIFLNERGMEYCNCALDLYRMGKIELPYEIVDLKAGFCYEQDKYQELIDFYLGLLPEWEHDKANELNGHAYVNLTLSYQTLGVHEEANLFCMRALDFYMNREETDLGWVCDWIYDAFSWFSKESLRQQALFYANKFIELNTDPSLKHAYLYSFLGRDYHEQGMVEQAVESYKKSLEFCSIDPQSCAWHIGEAEDYLNAHTDKVEK
ncbi:MAG TPA: hypothetical protein VN030_03455, partial [Cellvibrio sp.]|nr:hypothetical protein [Cellvibrio sp.]